MTRPRVAIVAGYFDWFSGYQETALAAALSERADVEVIAGDLVSPIFSDEHLAALGLPRRYATVDREPQHGATVTRVPVKERRSMVWSKDIRRVLRSRTFDLTIQVMPGQLLSVAPSLVRGEGERVALYGDNSAMWTALTTRQRALKWIAFAASKGIAYRYVNRRAVAAYYYTPETMLRLDQFKGTAAPYLMPLSYRGDVFFQSAQARSEWRQRLGVDPDDVLVVTAGKQDPYKELESLIAAVARIARSEPRVRLALAGTSDSLYSRSLRALVAAEPSLDGRVTFEGFLDSRDLNGFLNAADIGVWPKLPAITIQQALGTGLAVTLPRNDWVGHLLVDESVGTYFDPSFEGALTTAIAQMVGSVAFTNDARAMRAITNNWLSSSCLARELLERHCGNLPG